MALARGPMAPVDRNLALGDATDVRAIASLYCELDG